MIPARKFNKKFFSSGAYKNYQEILSEWVGPMAKRIYQLFQNKPEAKILDVGCGFGDLLAELEKKYNFEVAGLEYSSYAIKKADSRIKKKIKKGSILAPPFRKNSFDLVICFDVIYYFDYQETIKVIKNLINLSRGYIFFNSIYRHSPEASQKHNPDPLRKCLLSKKEYIDIFFQKGARLVKGFREANGGETLIFRKI